LHWHKNARIPLKTVTLKDGRSSYVTPLIKSLLRKRNKLMRRSKITEANALTLKIGRLIAEHRTNMLKQVDHRSIRSLWHSVKSNGTLPATRGADNHSDLLTDVNAINSYFADIATDKSYNDQDMQRIISFLANNNYDNNLLIRIDQWDV
jgi:hypothetical protein